MRKKPIRLMKHIKVIVNSIYAALIAGITMAVLNFLIDSVKRFSIFKFKNLFVISLWHVLIWVVIGLFIGLVFILYNLIKRKIVYNSLAFFICLYLFLAFWFLFLGYLNIYFFPVIFSFKSILGNIFLFLLGMVVLGIILHKFKKNRRIGIPKFFRVIMSLQLAVVLLAFFFNINISVLLKKETDKPEGKTQDKLNVIVILLDAVRSDHLGCYGYDRNTSPNIDRLAEEGVLFKKAFAQSSHTQESVPSLWTSVYPSSHRVKAIDSAIPQNIFTLPWVFKLLEYKTSVFTTIPYVSSTYGYNKGVDDFHERNNAIVTRTILAKILHKTVFEISWFNRTETSVLNMCSLFPSINSLISGDAYHVTQKIISWINKNQKKPFFIYAHYEGGHTPYNAPKKVKRIFVSDLNSKPITDPKMLMPFDENKLSHQKAFDNMLSLYDSKIFYHDTNIGRLIDNLEKNGIADKTIIIITSDHGEEFYDHEGFFHGYTVFDEVINVPLILYGTDLIPKGIKVEELVELIDIYPTLLNLCGITDKVKLPYKIEGRDLTSAFSSLERFNGRQYIFSEVNYDDIHSIRCVRTDNFKAIEDEKGEKTKYLLFDLISDPGEKKNIYDREGKIERELFGYSDILIRL